MEVLALLASILMTQGPGPLSGASGVAQGVEGGRAPERIGPDPIEEGPGAFPASIGSTTLRGEGSGFIENRGQWDPSVRFRWQHGGIAHFVVDDGWWMVLPAPGVPEGAAPAEGAEVRGVVLRFAIEGAEAGARGLGVGRLGPKTHWLVGRDESQHRRDLRSFDRIRLDGVLGGCGLVLRRSGGRLRFDLELAEDFDLSTLAIRVEGCESVTATPEGGLSISTAAGILEQGPPTAWCVDGFGNVLPVELRARALDEGRFGFEFTGPDPGGRLVIDPLLTWSTFLGGTNDQALRALARNAAGETFVAGIVDSFDFPVTPGAVGTSYQFSGDACLSCLSADGSTLLYSTFLGGTGYDIANGVEVLSDGRMVVAGETTSSDFPVTSGSFGSQPQGFRDLFVTCLDPSGAQLVYSGITGGEADERLNALGVTSGGSAVVCGSTRSDQFPVTPGAYDTSFNGGAFVGDAFVLRVRADGTALDYATFLGGTGEDAAFGLVLEDDEDVLVTGSTSSTNFPTPGTSAQGSPSGGGDGFVARLSASGASLPAATYVGGSQSDVVVDLDVDPMGRVLFGGSTSSTDLPSGTQSAYKPQALGQRDGMVGLLAEDLSSYVSLGYAGGAEDDDVKAVAIDSSGRWVVGGQTASQDLDTTPGTFDDELDGIPEDLLPDLFVWRLDPTGGQLDYGTYLGGFSRDELEAMVVHGEDSVVLCGKTDSGDYPTSPQAFQVGYGSTAVATGMATELRMVERPRPYGAAILSSAGSQANMYWSGFPGVSCPGGFELGVVGALPNTSSAVLFSGATPWNLPFTANGHILRVRPPLTRVAVMKPDLFGFARVPYPVAPSLVGQTLYFQCWYKDPGDPAGFGLSNGLEVTFHD